MGVKIQKQAFRHQPDKGIDGDCTRTCVAMLLGVDRDDVPHEHGVNTPEEYLAWKERIATLFCIRFITIALPPQDGWTLRDYCEFALARGQGLPLMLGGYSGNSTNHSVVINSNCEILDPAIDNSGIVGPCRPDGHYWLEWIVRSALTVENAALTAERIDRAAAEEEHRSSPSGGGRGGAPAGRDGEGEPFIRDDLARWSDDGGAIGAGSHV